MNINLFNEATRIMNPHPIYLVGGAVRDCLLGKEPKDYDFCTSATPDIIEERIHRDGKRAYLTGKRFGTIGCKIDGQMIEITTFRSEEYEKANRKPKVAYVKNLQQDLSRRDFTINAMAMRLIKGKIKLVDIYGGKKDLELKIIRCVGNPKQRFKEDALRILRAIRFASQLGFKIEDKSFIKMKEMAISILNISKERWIMELDKIFLSENIGIGIDYLFSSNLIKYIIPEMSLQEGYNQKSKYHNFTLLEHTKKVVIATPQEINLRWGAFLHDIAKPFVMSENKKGYNNYIGHEILGAEMVLKLADYLKWSNERKDKVVALVREHLKDNSELRKYDNLGKKNEN